MRWRSCTFALLILALLLGLQPVASAQVLCTDVRNARAFHGLGAIKMPPFLEMAQDPNTKVLLDNVFTVWGIQGANWGVLNFNDAKKYSNAWAIFCDSRHYIITNARYVEDMNVMVSRGSESYSKDETYWGLVGIIAHEAAHHFRNHAQIRARTTEEKHRYELEADHTMGFVLAKLGAGETVTIQAIRDLPVAGTDTHPPAAARRAEIARGWADGKETMTRGIGASPSVTIGLPPPAAVPPSQPSAPPATRSTSPSPPPTDAGPAATMPPVTDAAGTTRMSRDALPRAAPRSELSKFEYRHSRDIEGHDISSTGGKPGIPGTTHEVCAQLCDGEPRCKAYSFDKWHARCFLKDRVVESYLEPNSVLGVKKPGELPKLNTVAERRTEIYRNKVFRDDPIAPPKTAETFEACSASCETEKRCVVFAFEKATKKCSMFAKSDGFFFDQAFDSGAIRHLRDGEVTGRTRSRQVPSPSEGPG